MAIAPLFTTQTPFCEGLIDIADKIAAKFASGTGAPLAVDEVFKERYGPEYAKAASEAAAARKSVRIEQKPEMNGLEVIDQLRRPKVAVLVLSMHSEEQFAVCAPHAKDGDGHHSRDRSPATQWRTS
jgi:hypothetical protein